LSFEDLKQLSSYEMLYILMKFDPLFIRYSLGSPDFRRGRS
jgi:hypothetical protein